jgi:hypothetical protein
MHGLKPDDLPHLQTLEGKELIQIRVGRHDLQFHFHPEANIAVQGRCELLDENDRIVDEWGNDQQSETFRFFELLAQSVTKVEIDSPKSFIALFQNRFKLRFIDDSDNYESFSVGDLYV